MENDMPDDMGEDTAAKDTAADDTLAAELAELRAYRAKVESEARKAEEERARKAGEFEKLARDYEARASAAEAKATRAERVAELARVGVTDSILIRGAIAEYDDLPADTRPEFAKWLRAQTKDGGALHRAAQSDVSRGVRATAGTREKPAIPADAPRTLVVQAEQQWRALERQGMTQGKDKDEWVASFVTRLHRKG